MPIPWKDVTEKSEYQGLSLGEKELARRQYFSDVVMPNVPEEEQSAVKQEFLNYAWDLEKAKPDFEGFFVPYFKAVGRIGATMAAGLVAFPASGLAGYAKLLTSGPEEAIKTIEEIQALPSRFLKSEEDIKALTTIMKPIEIIDESTQFWGDLAFEKTESPGLATAVKAGLETLIYFATYPLFKSLGVRLTASIKAGRMAEANAILKEIHTEKLRILKEEPKRLEKLSAAEKEIAARGKPEPEPPPEKPPKKAPEVGKEPAAIPFDNLPESAKGAIASEARIKNEPVLSFVDSQWTPETVPIASLKNKNASVWGDEFTKRGSMTKGPLIVDDKGIVLDGNNRLREAIERGDREIDILRRVQALKPPEKLPATPGEEIKAKGIPEAPLLIFSAFQYGFLLISHWLQPSFPL